MQNGYDMKLTCVNLNLDHPMALRACTKAKMEEAPKGLHAAVAPRGSEAALVPRGSEAAVARRMTFMLPHSQLVSA